MAPKKAPDPPPVEEKKDGVKYAEWSEEALAAESFTLEAPYEDEAGCLLPAGYATSMVDWKRPSEFLAEQLEEGVVPCLVQQAVLEEGAEPTPPPRELPNVLLANREMAADSLESVAWVTSCFQLVAKQAALLEEGAFLWECIYPKAEGGAPAYQASGKYAVRLWEQGCWRMVIVDDRMPFDSSGCLLMPTSASPLELWPLILAKALMKLAAPYATSMSQDPAVLMHLTGWLPEVVPILDTQPATASFDAIAAALPAECECAIGLTLPAGAAEALASVGLTHGPLVAVCDARALADGNRYVCLESQLMQWEGPLRDTDEDSWSFELADALDWKRLQRLRLRGASLPLYDFWLSLASLNAYFSNVVLLHRPARYASVVSHSGTAGAAAAPPALLHVHGDPSEPPARLLLSLSATPAEPPSHAAAAEAEEADPSAPPPPPFGSCVLSLAAYHWSDAGVPAQLLSLPVTSAGTYCLTVPRGGSYRLLVASELPEGYPTSAAVDGYVPEATEDADADGAESAEPTAEVDEAEAGAPSAADADADADVPAPGELPLVVASPCHFTVTACCEAECHLGDEAAICEAQLGLQRCTLEGATPALEPAQWSIGASCLIVPKERATVAAALNLADVGAASCSRMHLVCEDTHAELSFSHFLTGGIDLDPEENPSGYSLLVDLKPESALGERPWGLTLLSTAELSASVTPVKPVTLDGAYEPNEAYQLCRLVLGAPSKCTAALHVSCNLPTADLTVRTIALTTGADGAPPTEEVLKTVSGRGCVTLFATGLDAPPPPAGKGAEPPPATTIILQCDVSRLSGLELGLPTKPAKPAAEGEEAEAEAAVQWKVVAASAAAVTLTKDPSREQELAAIAASWEAKAPGRAAKGKEARETYLSALAEAEAAAAAKAGAEGGGEEAGEEAGDAAFEALEADATATAADDAPTAELPRVVRKTGAEAREVTEEELAAWREKHAAELEGLVAEREAKAEARAAVKEAMGSAAVETSEAIKASRAEAQAALEAQAAEREALLLKLLPAPEEPVDAAPAKGKKK